jgi:cytochrome c peroxidase
MPVFRVILASALAFASLLAPDFASADDKSPSATAAQKVLLGSPDLTAGIPGSGKLTAAQIQAWLADPENHQPLQVDLPLGLASGKSSIQIPADNPLTRAKIELGRQLYFDPRLSADGTVSCASCHAPDAGYGKATRFGVGIGGQEGGRNSPVSYNRILSAVQFWDGRAATLEEQAKGPIANPIEMGNTHDVCVATLKKIPGYVLQFNAIFPGEGLTIDSVAKAIASFERAIITNPSPADYYEPLLAFENAFREDLEDLEGFREFNPGGYKKYLELKAASAAHPISESAQRGRLLFFDKRADCTACHVGANFTDEKYHNLGVGMAAAKPDLGRYEITKDEKDMGAFKTPTIRNVALSAPYMHDGSLKTLEEVVEWYDKGGHPNPHLSDKIKKLNLTPQEKQDLVAYMKSLTGEFSKVATGRLP